jgi:hypothetical protein
MAGVPGNQQCGVSASFAVNQPTENCTTTADNQLLQFICAQNICSLANHRRTSAFQQKE